jgi:hypothetical protein
MHCTTRDVSRKNTFETRKRYENQINYQQHSNAFAGDSRNLIRSLVLEF